MEALFQDLSKSSKADKSVFFSILDGEEFLFTHDFDLSNKAINKFKILFTSVSKLKKPEHCENIPEDPLYKKLNLKGSFVCFPLISSLGNPMGAIFLYSHKISFFKKNILQEQIIILANAYERGHQNKQTPFPSKNSTAYWHEALDIGLYYNAEEQILGIDPGMKDVFEKIKNYRKSSPILIEGETGTGKELVAKSIHYHSDRSEQPFVVLHCSELRGDEQSVLIKLFGCEAYEQNKNRKGYFRLADKGTIFLDGIEQLSLETQATLLRVVDNQEVRPVGAEENTIKIDVQILCATNTSLLDCVKKKFFREDLYYRLNKCQIKIPPLRERSIYDIQLLIDQYLDVINKKEGITKGLSSDLRKWLLAKEYKWPGNVRELQNTIEQMYHSTGSCTEITKDYLPKELANGAKYIPQIFPYPWESLEDVEKEMFNQASIWAEKHKKTQRSVAGQLGINEDTMTKKLRNYDIIWWSKKGNERK